MKRIYILLSLTLAVVIGCTAVGEPAPCGPVPSERQLAWHQLERYVFIHFTTNTFTDKEWGYGDESEQVFNPTDCNPRQWADIISSAGFKGIVLTAKHHDGFCLWDTKYTDHNIMNSPYGRDLVDEVCEACSEYGLKFGVYLSPWDRNRADYGEHSYIEYYRNQLVELLTNYGDIFEVWFDGANGGDGWYGGANERRKIDNLTYYEWPGTCAIVRNHQPQAIMFSDGGPDCRWVGNEAGFAGETNWSTLRKAEFAPGHADTDALNHGQEDGTDWLPAEVDVSIRPGWFYHSSEDDRVKSVDQLMDIYYNSIGRNANLILNVPPDRRGRIHPIDSATLIAFGKAIENDFTVNLALLANFEATNVRGKSKKFAASQVAGDGYWATDDSVTQASITASFKEPVTVSRLVLQEHIALGQRVQAFNVEALVDGQWKTLDEQTTIGYKRILRFDPVTTTAIRVNITAAKACIALDNVGLY